MITRIILLLLTCTCMIGCTVTKRKHLAGYSIQWKRTFQPVQKSITENYDLPTIYLKTQPSTQLAEKDSVFGQHEIPSDIEINNSAQAFDEAVVATKNSREVGAFLSKNDKSRQELVSIPAPPYVDDRALEKMSSAGMIIMGVGLFFLLCILFAYAGIGGSNSILGIILQILMGLLGLLLIDIFGQFYALIFATSILLAGLILMGIGSITLSQRRRFQEKEPGT